MILKEASYGGAYDIEDDMYFTKEDLLEFTDELIDTLQDKGIFVDLVDMYITDGNRLVIAVEDEDGNEIDTDEFIDMRKIRRPKDIYKYKDIFIKNILSQYNEFKSFNEDLDDEIKPREPRVRKDYFGVGNFYYIGRKGDLSKDMEFIKSRGSGVTAELVYGDKSREYACKIAPNKWETDSGKTLSDNDIASVAYDGGKATINYMIKNKPVPSKKEEELKHTTKQKTDIKDIQLFYRTGAAANMNYYEVYSEKDNKIVLYNMMYRNKSDKYLIIDKSTGVVTNSTGEVKGSVEIKNKPAPHKNEEELNHTTLTKNKDILSQYNELKSFNEDLDEIPIVDKLNFINKRGNGMPGIANINEFIDCLNSVGKDKFMVKETKVGSNLSLADLKDEWMTLKRKGWKWYTKNIPGEFLTYYVFEKINKGENMKENLAEDDLQQLKAEVENEVEKYMTSEGFEPDEVKEYSAVDVYLDSKERDTAIVEVRAELSYDGLFELGLRLDKIVANYDEEAYFEPEEPGITTAYIHNITPEKINKRSKQIKEDYEDEPNYLNDLYECLIQAQICIDKIRENYPEDIYSIVKLGIESSLDEFMEHDEKGFTIYGAINKYNYIIDNSSDESFEEAMNESTCNYVDRYNNIVIYKCDGKYIATAINGKSVSGKSIDDVKSQLDKIDAEYTKHFRDLEEDKEDDDYYDDEDDENNNYPKNLPEQFYSLYDKLNGDFWTRKDELKQDIEEINDLEYSVEELNDEYVIVTDPEDDMHALQIFNGGTERTYVLDFDRIRYL